MRYTCLVFLAVVFCCACHPGNNRPKTTADDDGGHRALVAQYFACFNKHDWEQLAALYMDRAELKDPAYGTGSVHLGRTEIVAKYRELQKAIPDVQDSVAAVYTAGDDVVVEFVSSGTAPDSSRFRLPICTIFRVENGKISRDLTYYDNPCEPQP